MTSEKRVVSSGHEALILRVGEAKAVFDRTKTPEAFTAFCRVANVSIENTQAFSVTSHAAEVSRFMDSRINDITKYGAAETVPFELEGSTLGM